MRARAAIILVLVIGLVFSVSLSGCKKGEAKPDTVVVGMSDDINSIDPHTNTLAPMDTSALYPNLYDRFITRGLDGSLQPELVTSWENQSPTKWKMTLKQGVKFHNGEAFNAEVLKYNIERPNACGGLPKHPRMLAAKSVEIIDDYTVIVESAAEDPLFLESFCQYRAIPKAYIEEVGEEGFLAHPVGTGPYKFVEWKKGEYLTLEANPEYWKGAPKIQKLILRVIPDAATRLAALQAGDVNIALNLAYDQVSTIAEDAELRVETFPLSRCVYMEFFPTSPKGTGEPLADVRVRQAINYAINVDDIIKYVLNGMGQRITVPSPVEAFGYNKDIQPYPYDPAKARELLAQAGYSNGFELKIDVGTLGLASAYEVVDTIVSDLAKVGINATVNRVETAAYADLKVTTFGIAPFFLWQFNGYDVSYVLYKQIRSGQPWFYNPAWTAEWDELLDSEHFSFDQAHRETILKEICQRLHDEAVFVPLFQPLATFGVVEALDWVPGPEGSVGMAEASFR